MSENEQEFTDFPIEFHSEIDSQDFDLYAEAEERLRKLAKGHTDITGASIVVELPAEKRSTPFVYRARVVVYSRPEYISAEEQADDAYTALKVALSAVERQVRQKREKLHGH